ncbi:MAG: hypothetical protein CMJ19_09515 [Phycisphaeraceae bacterium]|nr:hypothetical protein [Phycisphaeraceae bacterium]
MTDTPPEKNEQDQVKTQTTGDRIAVVGRVLFGLVIAALIVNLLLNLSSTLWPTWLPHKMSGTGFQKDITQRVHAAEAAFVNDPELANAKLAVFLGLSSQRESVNLATLTEIDGIDAKYLGLCGAGASMATMQQQGAALLESELKPDLVIIGINLYHQVDPLVIAQHKQPETTEVQETGLPIVSPLVQGDIRQAYHDTRERVWVYDRRRDVNTVITENLATVNAGIMQVFHTTSQSGANEVTSPWREMIRIDGPEKASEATYIAQNKSYANRGLFEAQSYQPDWITAEHNALNTVIKQTQERGAKVVIMLMPEHSRLRASVPEVAMQRLKTDLDQTFGDAAPEIVDMRDSLADDNFSDISHTNSAGRMQYSKLIAPMLVKWLQ